MRRQYFADAVTKTDAISVALAEAREDDFVVVGQKLAYEAVAHRYFPRAFPAKLQHGSQ